MLPLRKLFLLVLLLPACAQAQHSFDSLMVRRVPNCLDIAYNCTYLFEQYVRKGDEDSTRMLLEYWADKCPAQETIHRARLLSALRFHTYNDSLLDDDALYYVIHFRDLVKYIGNHSPSQDQSVFRPFDDYTLSLAASLLNDYEAGTIEQWWCRLYSGNVDSALSEIHRPQYAKTKIYRLHQQALARCKQVYDGHWAVLAGLWIPTGEATRLGIHPELGVQGGIEFDRFTLDGTMFVRFLDTPNPYLSWNPQLNYVTSTDYFLGIYLGADVGYRLNRGGDNGVYLLAGIGYDGFDTFYFPYDEDINAPTAESFNFNFGTGCRFALKNGMYLGLQVKYNVVDYSQNHVVEFTGNTVNIDLVVGRVSTCKKQCRERLEPFSHQ